MNWNNVVGPATFIYLLSITVGGIWWASDLSARVAVAEVAVRDQANSTQRIVALETVMTHVDKQLDKIEAKIDAQRDR